MSNTLPLTNQTWPLLRVLTRARFNANSDDPQTSGTGGWTVWPANSATGNKNGLYVLDWERVCLPMVGRARFGFRFGRIDGQIIGVSQSTASSLAGGAPYSVDTSGTTLPDLNGHEVRIQAADAVAAGSTPKWRTVWWGQVDCTQDVGWPGSSVPSGDRIYQCVDGLYRTNRWALNRHGYAGSDAISTIKIGNLRGHPGYNVGTDRDSRLSGNRWSGADQWSPDAGGSTSLSQCFYHAQSGSADAGTWSDQQVLEHALAATRQPGEPLFALVFTPSTADSMLASGSAWPVREGDTAWDIITKVMRRERGRGVAFVDWADDVDDPTGPLTVLVRIMPQTFGDITYDDPTSQSSVTISGAHNDAAAQTTVDLINDHRLVVESFKLGDKDQYRIDALETVGEFIQVLVTVGFTDGATGASPNVEGHSLQRAWSAADQSTFRGLTEVKRQEERYRAIYNLFQLPPAWDFVAGDGNGGNLSRCDYRCSDGGVVIGAGAFGTGGVASEATSLLCTEILSDLPLYEAWDYRTATPARWDTGIEHVDQPRRPILALLKVATGKFVKVEEVAGGMTMKVDGRAFWFFDSAGLGDGSRLISDPSLSTLHALATVGKYENLCFTVALQLPHRARFYSGKPPTDADCRRRSQICIPDHHLWLAHPGAIWELDASSGTASSGHAARTKAAPPFNQTQPGLLRDDRSALARQHYLAWSWYGTERRSVAWALRACGALPSYLAYPHVGIPTNGSSASPILYATLGKTVTTLKANGETVTINTPVTRISYDNQAGITTWETDWCTLDLAR